MRLADPFTPLPFIADIARLSDEMSAVPLSRWTATEEPGCQTLPLVTTADGTPPGAGIGVSAQPTVRLLARLRGTLAALNTPMGLCNLIHLDAAASYEREASLAPYEADRLLIILALQPLRAAVLGETRDLAAGSLHAIDTANASSFENLGKAGPAAAEFFTTGTAALWRALRSPMAGQAKLLHPARTALQFETGGRRVQTADVIVRQRQRLMREITSGTMRTKLDTILQELAFDWQAAEATFNPNDTDALQPFVNLLAQFEKSANDPTFNITLPESGVNLQQSLQALAAYMMHPNARQRFAPQITGQPDGQNTKQPVFILGTRSSPASAIYDLLAHAPELTAMTPASRNLLSAAPPKGTEADDTTLARLQKMISGGRPVHYSAMAMQQVDLLNRAFPDASFVLCWDTPSAEDAEHFIQHYSTALKALGALPRDRLFVAGDTAQNTIDSLCGFLAIAPLKAPPTASPAPPSYPCPETAQTLCNDLENLMTTQPDWQAAS